MSEQWCGDPEPVCVRVSRVEEAEPGAEAEPAMQLGFIHQSFGYKDSKHPLGVVKSESCRLMPSGVGLASL